LNDRIENYKNNLTKYSRKTIRNQKKRNQIEIIIIIGKKNHKLDLKDKTKSYKFFDKKTENKLKLKVERPNQKTLYTQIKNQGLN
jgi:hypothetical protein